MTFGQWPGRTNDVFRGMYGIGHGKNFVVRYSGPTHFQQDPTQDRVICFGDTTDEGRHVQKNDWVIVNDDGTLFRELDYLPILSLKQSYGG